MNADSPDPALNRRPQKGRKTTRGPLAGRFATLIGLLVMLATSAPCLMGKVRETAHRSVAGSNLRQIGQASLIYASEHEDKLPGAVAADVWDYARLTALHGGLNDATLWASVYDPAVQDRMGKLSTVLTRDRAGLHLEFPELKPTWAVALGELHAGLPGTTPIAWTRGLQPDGTWAAHSPNGTDGGHIVFLGGNVTFYRNTRDAFTRFDGQGMSSDIRDALPPGTRIAQYEPTAEEQTTWAKATRVRQVERRAKPLLLPLAWLVVGVVLLTQALRRRWPLAWFLWYLALSVIAAWIIPTV